MKVTLQQILSYAIEFWFLEIRDEVSMQLRSYQTLFLMFPVVSVILLVWAGMDLSGQITRKDMEMEVIKGEMKHQKIENDLSKVVNKLDSHLDEFRSHKELLNQTLIQSRDNATQIKQLEEIVSAGVKVLAGICVVIIGHFIGFILYRLKLLHK